MRLRFASAFSGLGGFEVGFNAAGMDATVHIEIDQACQQVLTHHWPQVSLKGDISDVAAADLGRPEIFVGGFPCQDTSIAAPHRSGLEGERSCNFWGFHRVLYDFLRLIDGSLPIWVVIENPVGLLASPGRSKVDGVDRTGWDMAAVVRALEDLGYRWAYRVVDGRSFGSPQKRERVILVGHLGDHPTAAGDVLGLFDTGSEAAAPRYIGTRNQGGPAPRSSTEGPGGELIWRKSARARASLDKGGYETWVPATHANTLTGFDGGLPTRQTHLIKQGDRLRTLTLTEWERLQCLPDGHTDVGIPDSARFTMLGNAMHAGMAQWLGERIVSVHQAIHPTHRHLTSA